MKKIANIIVIMLCLGFIGWCLYTGNAAEDRREAFFLQQQEKGLQQARMARVRTEDIRDTAYTAKN